MGELLFPGPLEGTDWAIVLPQLNQTGRAHYKLPRQGFNSYWNIVDKKVCKINFINMRKMQKNTKLLALGSLIIFHLFTVGAQEKYTSELAQKD